MRLVITAQAYDDLEEGTPVVWGYHHEERIIEEKADINVGPVLRGERGPTEDELAAVQETMNRNAGRLLEQMIARLEEAKASIEAQAAAGLPRRGEDGRP